MDQGLQITESLQTGFDRFFGFLPNLVAFLVILLIAYIVARVLRGLLTRVLQSAGLDRQLQRGQAGQYISRAVPSPSGLIATIGFWLVFLGGLSIAVGVLQIQLLQDFVSAIFAYIPKLIAGLLIFLVAGALAGAVGGLVQRTMGETPTGKIVKTAVPALIMAIAAFMILDQLGIAENIVTITYAALIGAIALGSALAFGLGGREMAGQLLQGAVQAGQEQSQQVRQDVQTGRERGQQQAQQVRQEAQQRAGSGDASGESRRQPGSRTAR